MNYAKFNSFVKHTLFKFVISYQVVTTLTWLTVLLAGLRFT